MSAARSRRTCSRTMLRWGARSSSTQPFAGRRSTGASIGGCRLQSKRSEVRETLRPRGRACLRGCLADVFGKRIIETRLHRNVTVREENSVAALEAMSRFAANPRWLVYLPPTMSPPETSRRPGLLEHPDEAFAYFRREGVVRVRTALDNSGFWDEHKTDWALLDCELMPWSVKAQDLIRDQYAAVGAAS